MQQRRQYRAADENVREAAGVGSTEALAVALCALNVVGFRRSRLINAGEYARSRYADDIRGSAKCELILQLRRERHKALVIDNIEVGNDSEDALLLFILDLLTRQLFGLDRRHRRFKHADRKLNVCKIQLLTRLEDECGRGP